MFCQTLWDEKLITHEAEKFFGLFTEWEWLDYMNRISLITRCKAYNASSFVFLPSSWGGKLQNN